MRLEIEIRGQVFRNEEIVEAGIQRPPKHFFEVRPQGDMAERTTEALTELEHRGGMVAGTAFNGVCDVVQRLCAADLVIQYMRMSRGQKQRLDRVRGVLQCSDAKRCFVIETDQETEPGKEEQVPYLSHIGHGQQRLP